MSFRLLSELLRTEARASMAGRMSMTDCYFS